jgi:prepilin-type processing-associated H-X9-DG protein
VPIPVTCTCGRQFLATDADAGHAARCPDCGRDVMVPRPGAPASVAATATSAPGAVLGPPQTSGKALASLILGISSFFCSIVTGIPAVVLGILGLREIDRSGGQRTGKGLAMTGLILGAISCVMVPVLAGLLVGLILPAVQAARGAAERAQCMNNLRQIGLAMINYADAHNVFPPATTVEPDGKALLSWRVLLLPYLGEQALYEQFKLEEPWDSPNNKPLLARMPGVFRCPTFKQGASDVTIYQVLIGPKTMFESGAGMRIAAVTDGLANTLLVVESHAPIAWTQPSAMTSRPRTPIVGLGGIHSDGFNALFADGSVRFLKRTVAADVLEALVTRNGDEVVSLDPL